VVTSPPLTDSTSGTLWDNGRLFAQARTIPGAIVFVDRGARESAAFGARVSGTVLLYSAGGDLTFQGGITASRGHVGENFGQESLVRALRTGSRQSRIIPPFGCALPQPKDWSYDL